MKLTESTMHWGSNALLGRRVELLMQALRAHHWSKNLLLLLPILAERPDSSIDAFLRALLAFFSFCMLSSSGYIFNDLLDLESNRQHPVKRNRPLASGNFSVKGAHYLAWSLLVMALCLGWQLGQNFAFSMLAYALMALFYMTLLKQTVLWDVVVLALLYCIRVVAGYLALGPPSSLGPALFWLVTICLFFFANLALLKRFVQVRELSTQPQLKVLGRTYSGKHEKLLLYLGAMSALLCLPAGLMLAERSGHAQAMAYLLVPALFWVIRFWNKARRGEVLEDLVLFLYRDRVTWAFVILALIFLRIF